MATSNKKVTKTSDPDTAYVFEYPPCSTSSVKNPVPDILSVVGVQTNIARFPTRVARIASLKFVKGQNGVWKARDNTTQKWPPFHAAILLLTGDAELERADGRGALVVLGPAGVVAGVVAHHAPDQQGAVGEQDLPLVHGQHLA